MTGKMLGAHLGIQGTADPPESEKDVARAIIMAVVEEKLTDAFVAIIQNPQALKMLTFEIQQAFKEVQKWHGKK